MTAPVHLPPETPQLEMHGEPLVPAQIEVRMRGLWGRSTSPFLSWAKSLNPSAEIKVFESFSLPSSLSSHILEIDISWSTLSALSLSPSSLLLLSSPEFTKNYLMKIEPLETGTQLGLQCNHSTCVCKDPALCETLCQRSWLWWHIPKFNLTLNYEA